MPWRIDTYHTPSGKAPLEAFTRSLGGGLFELRTKSGVRVFYVFRPGQQVVLLDGIVKKRDDIPASVVTRMRELAEAIR